MAATATNPLDSAELVVETKLNIDELIKMLNHDDLPMISGIGSDGFPVIGREAVDNYVFYWLEEDVMAPRTALAGALTNVATTVTVTTGTGIRFSVGDAFRVDDEVFVIASIAGDVLTVSARGQAGTSAVSHLDLATVIGLGTYLDEGEIGTENFLGRDKYSNYTQILTSQISMTRTAQKIPKYGVPSELAKQTSNLMFAEGTNLENIFLYGVKFQSALKRMTGGLDYFITTNVEPTYDWLTVQEIEKMQGKAFSQGGSFDAIIAQPASFQALNNVAGAERIQTVEVSDNRRGRQRARVVVTEFGEVDLVRNRHVMPTDAFAINREDIVHRVFQPMIMQPLAKTKDVDSWMFVYEGGFEVKGQRHMGKWTGLDLAAALPTGLV